MPGPPFKKKGWKVYHALKEKGMSTERAAKITTSMPGTRTKAKKKKNAKAKKS